MSSVGDRDRGKRVRTKAVASAVRCVKEEPCARKTRAASKRAMDEPRAGGLGTVAGNRTKRIALTNLSNSGGLLERVDDALKGQGLITLEVTRDREDGHLEEHHEALAESMGPSCSLNDQLLSSAGDGCRKYVSCNQADCDRETQLTSHDTVVSSAGHGSAVEADCAAMASLERRTEQNLRISQEPQELGLDRMGWSASLGFQDIDAKSYDPQMCSSYVNEIYGHLREAEWKGRPSTSFMEDVQQDINSNMRGILIDWLVEVAEEYKLVPDTLYLTVLYIDRYLSGNVVTRSRLQLLGVSCMLIAAKYEEIYAPQVEEFCYITDNTYRREEVLEMERAVLSELRFELATPTTKSFLRRFVRAAQAGKPMLADLRLEFLGNYLAELTLVEYGFLKFLPSTIAAAAVFVAKYTLDSTTNPWTATLQHYSGYIPKELEECARAIHCLQLNGKGCQLPAIREKYRQHKFKQVANLVPPLSLPACLFEWRGSLQK